MILYVDTVDVSGEPQDAPHVVEQWVKIIDSVEQRYGEHCFALVTDTPAVHQVASQLLKDKKSHISWIPCLAHCLNLFFKDSVSQEFPEIAALWANVKNIVHMFHARGYPRALLRDELLRGDYPDKLPSNPLKGVTKICELRFANAFLVISRLARIGERVRTVAVFGKLQIGSRNFHEKMIADSAEKFRSCCRTSA